MMNTFKNRKLNIVFFFAKSYLLFTFLFILLWFAMYKDMIQIDLDTLLLLAIPSTTLTVIKYFRDIIDFIISKQN
ncbi:hypothetical protein CWC45_01805 [Neisseria sp. N177_16]|nr:hypothetical protein CWC45_01805 [Neisseria sp. N177_16]